MTTILPRQQLPQRLSAMGWDRSIYVRGVLAEGPAVAIVGARGATTVAMQWAFDIAKHLVKRGVHVVSGGALGIDGAGHRGALSGGGSTTVVLGTGVDIAYPERHAGLFQEALQAGGALVSLVPDGTPPRRFSFVRRNQLIAALVDAVIVVEADVRSGSLSTARAATEYQRVVAARPGSPGCDRLLADGAAIVQDVADVDRVLAGTPRHAADLRAPGLGEQDSASLEELASVRDAIAGGACGIDAIVDCTQLSVPRVLRALARLP